MSKFSYYMRDNYKKIIGWGTGGYYNKYFELSPVDIEYLIDSNMSLWGKEINEKKVNAPGVLENEDPETTLIVIYSSFYDEITNVIKKYGDFYTISGDALNVLSSNFEIAKTHFYSSNDLEMPTIISISRNNFALYIGGTSKFIREQMEILNRNNYINLHIFWKEYNLKNFSDVILNVVKNGEYLGMYTIQEFLYNLRNTRAIIIHNLIGMNLDTLDTILDSLSKEVIILYYLHDFSSLCKSIKLIYNSESFCKAYENEWNKCLTCVNGKDRTRIFNYHEKLFNKNNVRSIAPSKSTKDIICKCFNISGSKISIIEHQKYNIVDKKDNFINKKIRIAYVGYKDIFKGWEIFKQICGSYKDKYEFFCLGSSDEIIDGVKYIDVSFIEEGQDAMTKKLIENSIDISLLWSLCPETYSYTYYESFFAGTFVLTNELSGNIADQVKINNNGIVLKDYEGLIKLLSNENELRNLLLKNDKRIENIISNNEFIKFINEV